MLRRICRGRPALATALLALVVFLLVQLRNAGINDGSDDFHYGSPASGQAGGCPPGLDYLKSLRLADKILFSRRRIKPVVSKAINRDEVLNISVPLFPKKQAIDLSSCASTVLEPGDTLQLKVPPLYPKRTYPEFIFGIATSADRLRDSIGPLSYWLSGSSAKLVAIISERQPATADQLQDLRHLFATQDIDAVILNPTDKSLTTSQNHFAMIRDMVRLSTPSTKWLGILDDDTFFPSLHPLAAELALHDPDKPQYIGALSEDFRAVKNWGYMAFGGAGVFLSLPAATTISAHLEECLAGSTSSQGDGILRDCVHRHTRARLTQVQGLHQQDMHGDASGFFEAGMRPLSLHHWKSWYRHPVDEMALVTRFCGECFLQRWRFGGDTVLTNGYSIAVYPGGLDAIDLGKTEETWGESGGAFEFSLGPLREKLPRGAKRSHTLVHSAEVSPGTVRQVYVLKGNSRDHEPDEVVELLWDFT
ncbi:uncharacterized protein DNG_00105 [Cephalotrichum gorgonifer]|uniref:Glycosyltransferase family 31 protein n=1 Tax=Cephalotrichum gorgonifer TaxID=2041049 RepID=A0AAE8MQ72_9PEZI|nr:uncharacterized protein DNG_00105 [Cephalotrichum gorgonifer]